MAEKILIWPDDPKFGVCVGGRWDGWLMRKHRDGHWMSMQKLAEEDPRAGMASVFGALTAQEKTDGK